MKQILFIHGGGQGSYEEDKQLAVYLQNVLGRSYNVRYPQMPNADAPEYQLWRAQINEELATLDGGVILVGHSLGGSVLLKYLSEEQITKAISGLFLLAPPYWGGDEDWQVAEYMLQEDFATRLLDWSHLFFYHSRDDEVVPFAHLALYAEKLPHATIREFADRGHQFKDDLSEVAEDVKQHMA